MKDNGLPGENLSKLVTKGLWVLAPSGYGTSETFIFGKDFLGHEFRATRPFSEAMLSEHMFSEDMIPEDTVIKDAG